MADYIDPNADGDELSPDDVRNELKRWMLENMGLRNDTTVTDAEKKEYYDGLDENTRAELEVGRIYKGIELHSEGKEATREELDNAKTELGVIIKGMNEHSGKVTAKLIENIEVLITTAKEKEDIGMKDYLEGLLALPYVVDWSRVYEILRYGFSDVSRKKIFFAGLKDDDDKMARYVIGRVASAVMSSDGTNEFNSENLVHHIGEIEIYKGNIREPEARDNAEEFYRERRGVLSKAGEDIVDALSLSFPYLERYNIQLSKEWLAKNMPGWKRAGAPKPVCFTPDELASSFQNYVGIEKYSGTAMFVKWCLLPEHPI